MNILKFAVFVSVLTTSILVVSEASDLIEMNNSETNHSLATQNQTLFVIQEKGAEHYSNKKRGIDKLRQEQFLRHVNQAQRYIELDLPKYASQELEYAKSLLAMPANNTFPGSI
jgi:hypothetical protein